MVQNRNPQNNQVVTNASHDRSERKSARQTRAYFVRQVSRHVAVVKTIAKSMVALTAISILIVFLTVPGSLLTGVNIYYSSRFASSIVLLFLLFFYLWIASGIQQRKKTALVAMLTASVLRIAWSLVVMHSCLQYGSSSSYQDTATLAVVLTLFVLEAIVLVLNVYIIVVLLRARDEFREEFWEADDKTVIR